MSGVIATNPRVQFFDNNGDPLAAGYLYTYAAGTTTDATTYTDIDLDVSHENSQPITLDARGECVLWLDPTQSYKFVLKDLNSNTLYTVDNVSGAARSATYSASSGSASIGFLQAGTGATARTMQAKGRERYSVQDFGAALGGAVDETAYLQAAIDAAVSGSVLELGGGTLLFSSVTINKPLTIRGCGTKGTTLRTNSATANAITITTTSAVTIEDLTLDASVTRTAGAYIKVDPASSYNGNSTFNRLDVISPFIGLDFVDASDFTLRDCYFGSCVSIGVKIQNVATPDAGDSTIYGCTFDGGSGATAVAQYSSGGLRITNNKFLDCAYQYLGEWSSGASATSILLINGNSFENASSACIGLNSTASTGFAKVLIQNNQFSVAASATGILISDPTYDYLDAVDISGNQVYMGASATGLSCGRVARLNLGRNSWLGNGASITAISMGANVDSAVIAPQVILNCATQYSGTYTACEFNPPRIEKGSQAGVATSTGYSGLYSTAATVVTFTTPFPKAPAVHANCTSTGGGVGVLINAVTTTDFTYTAVGVTNGGSVPIVWTAMG
jgi:hypothetical protein